MQIVNKKATISRPGEHFSHVLFWLSDVHVEQFGSFDAKEAETALGGDSFGQEGLANARGSVKKDSGPFVASALAA